MLLTSGCYVARLAWHHQGLYLSKRPVSDVIADPNTTEKTREALIKTLEILDFAATQGLKTQGAYLDYIATPRPVVSYIVQAAYKDHLELVTWWFPIVGSVPYLGYYEAKERDAKAKELQAADYDVTTGGVGAFSSLGWFDDPIFSSMLSRSHAELTHLLLHELIHRTLWIPGSTEFNENLAEYCAGILTEAYFQEKKDEPALRHYHKKMRDKNTFRVWLWDLKTALTHLYDAQPRLAPPELARAKQQVFATFRRPPRRPKFEAVDFIGDEEWNNATVLAEALYAPDTAIFARAHACLGQKKPIRAFLDAIRETHKKRGGRDPFSSLSALCPP